MSPAKITTCAAIVLFAAGAGCSSAEPAERSPTHAAGVQPIVLQEQDQGWAALVEADREIKDLEALRDSTDDPFVKDAMSHQILSIAARSDSLMDEMSVGDGMSHDTRIRRLAANLQRSMSAGVAAEMQGGTQGETSRSR